MSFESFFVVLMAFLPRALRVVVEPVEQSVQLMLVMIVHMFQVGDHQFAYGMQSVLQWVMEWFQGQHSVCQSCVAVVRDPSPTTCRMCAIPMKSPPEDVQERHESAFQHDLAMQPWEHRFVLFPRL